MRVAGKSEQSSQATLPVTTQTFRLRDEASGREVVVRSAFAGPLKRFPMPVMGCALNSGAPSWQCFHGFMRDSVTPVAPPDQKYGGGTVVVAAALGLEKVQDWAALATGPERFRGLADAADAKLVAKEIAILERDAGQSDRAIARRLVPSSAQPRRGRRALCRAASSPRSARCRRPTSGSAKPGAICGAWPPLCPMPRSSRTAPRWSSG